MHSETTTHQITFRHPFCLPGMAEAHRAGTFDFVIEKIPLDVSWEAYRMSCSLMLADGGTISAQPVSLADVESALLADRQHDTASS